MHKTPSNPTETQRTGGAIGARIVLIACTAIAALFIWVVSVPVLGVDLVVGSGSNSRTVGPVAVAVIAVLAGACAWAVRALFERGLRRPRRLWRLLGWLFLAVSLLGPVSMAQSWQVLVTLLAMHLVVGATLIIGLGATSRRSPPVSYREPAKAVQTR